MILPRNELRRRDIANSNVVWIVSFVARPLYRLNA